MTDLYPRMLYKVGGPHEIHGGNFDHIIVGDEDAQMKALADGWAFTTESAKELAEIPAHVPGVDNSAPPSRIELEQKATSLDIKFDGRTTNAKLAEKIDAALKG